MLTRSGIKSHVYDRNQEIGGLLTFGIPEFKLEKSVIKRRRKILEEMGISFHLGKEIGKDVPFKSIYEDYDAVFLAMGTYTSLEGGHLLRMYMFPLQEKLHHNLHIYS